MHKCSKGRFSWQEVEVIGKLSSPCLISERQGRLKKTSYKMNLKHRITRLDGVIRKKSMSTKE